MDVLLIVAHPKRDSFNHALGKSAIQALEQLGHTVIFHDLYAEHFDPVLPADEDRIAEEELPQNIRDYLADLRKADGIIIVHPNWWGSPPAILRGWIERVIRTNSCYNFSPQGPVSYIGGKTVQIFSTSNTPFNVEQEVYGDPVGVFWKTVVFGVIGSQSYERRNFDSVVVSTPENRQKWLTEVSETVLRRFGHKNTENSA
ncbi:MAG: NAD(P)H-dependent oxidoreductase [Planctomycetaceae bacterium]|jgi:putative NADPH-quinone reductase|nr:NAD(P)H-dependent oxidoreductase [Planctomycetaceae bacterium]